MNLTGIEWVRNPDGTQGCTLNSKTGCQNHTPEGLCLGGLFPCYAYKLAHGRLKRVYQGNHNIAESDIPAGDYPRFDPFYPRWWPERVVEPGEVKKPIGIFLDNMSDWMLDCWPMQWTAAELQMMRDNPQHRFYTLTKQAQNLPQFSPFPENCWVGVTATNTSMAWIASKQLSQIEAGVKFLSIEPLLSWKTSTPYTTENIVAGLNGSLDWLVIGACTGTKKEMGELCKRYPELTPMPWGKKWTAQPRIEWVREIVEAADKAGMPVFLKNNLEPLIYGQPFGYDDTWAVDGKFWVRQEMPGADFKKVREV